ncbi:uncharacterized protein G2W53_003918 [Senna tora]|uniref:Uncharacterized protein n=1 Tax=Senna tora TaxID=362788 RepID=A0A835CIV1_9FABA|nr:uncharacterized protein G2W53_003918 [Senna tora]
MAWLCFPLNWVNLVLVMTDIWQDRDVGYVEVSKAQLPLNRTSTGVKIVLISGSGVAGCERSEKKID